MTEKEYFRALDKLNNDIESMEAGAQNTEVDKKLDELFQYKPVRLRWYICKAKWIIKSKDDYPAALKVLQGKECPLIYSQELEEFYNIYVNWAKKRNDIVDIKRNQFILNCQCQGYYDTDNNVESDNIENEKKLQEVYDFFFEKNDVTMCLMVTKCMEKFGFKIPNRKWIKQSTNAGFLEEMFNSKTYSKFIIIEESVKEKRKSTILIELLKVFDREIIYISTPENIEVDKCLDEDVLNQVTFDNIEVIDNVRIYHPIQTIINGKMDRNNLASVMDNIATKCNNEHFAVLCNGNLLDTLCQNSLLQKKLERLTTFYSGSMNEKTEFGWLGNYLSYIELIYGKDNMKNFYQKPEYQFSIVIPARNSAASLRYTIQTCLNQRYQGNYEIVISDNSTDGNTDIYQLVQEINDERIHYYRTPRNLHLTKSFEFSYLQAKGEYILSIGSDDGLLPWTLEVLDRIWTAYPDEEILNWDRGFYAWPGFSIEQENEFIIPAKYKKDDYGLQYVSGIEKLKFTMNHPEQVYTMPMLYISSAFKRSFLNKLIQKTGRLWDGICQDMYMAVAVACTSERYVNIKYPLSIAGMTGASVGANSDKVIPDGKLLEKMLEERKKTGNIGAFVTSPVERLFPDMGTTLTSFYNSILRMVARGTLSKTFLESEILWKDWYIEAASALNKKDMLFDKKINQFRYAVSLHGDALSKWFAPIDRLLCEPGIENSDNEKRGKIYTEGKNENGAIYVDASKYSVYNIYDASLLFERMTGL